LPGKVALKLLEVFDEDTTDAEQMIIPDEVMMQMQQQQAEQQAEEQADQGEMGHERDMQKIALKGQRPKENNTAQMGQDMGREQSKGIRQGA